METPTPAHPHDIAVLRRRLAKLDDPELATAAEHKIAAGMTTDDARLLIVLITAVLEIDAHLDGAREGPTKPPTT